MLATLLESMVQWLHVYRAQHHAIQADVGRTPSSGPEVTAIMAGQMAQKMLLSVYYLYSRYWTPINMGLADSWTAQPPRMAAHHDC